MVCGKELTVVFGFSQGAPTGNVGRVGGSLCLHYTQQWKHKPAEMLRRPLPLVRRSIVQALTAADRSAVCQDACEDRAVSNSTRWTCHMIDLFPLPLFSSLLSTLLFFSPLPLFSLFPFPICSALLHAFFRRSSLRRFPSSRLRPAWSWFSPTVRGCI